MGLERGYNYSRRKCGRVVDCTGLENRRLERVREFESHRFRQVNRVCEAFNQSGVKLPHLLPQTI